MAIASTSLFAQLPAYVGFTTNEHARVAHGLHVQCGRDVCDSLLRSV